jgi:hypothetical protein
MVSPKDIKKGRSRPKTRQLIAPREKWKSLLEKLRSPIGIFVGAVSLFLTGLGIYLELEVKLSVEPEPSVKSESLISTPFRITNEGRLPLYKVQQEWLLEEGRGRFGSAEPFYELERINAPHDVTAALGGSQSATVYPFDYLTVQEVRTRRLKLMAIITYETPILRRDRSTTFIFEANEVADGKFYWYNTDIPH